jgi:predicted nuclease with TOPRIM domain
MSIFGSTNRELKVKIEELQGSLNVALSERDGLLAKVAEIESANAELADKLDSTQKINVALATQKEAAESKIAEVEQKAVDAVSDFDKKVNLAAISVVGQAGHEAIEAAAEDQEKDADVLKIYGSIKDKDQRFAYFQANKKEIMKKSFN